MQRKRKEGNVQELMYRDTPNVWNMKCVVMPVITGATGIETKALEKRLEAMPGKRSVDSPQKTAVRGASHIVQKVLQSVT